MGITLDFFIENWGGSPINDARFKLENEDGSIIASSTINLPADGRFQFPMTGQGKLEGDLVAVHVDDFTGANHSEMKSSYGFNPVVSDGEVPPPLGQEKSVVAFGDSITDFGSSSDGVTGRPANEFLEIGQNGYWCSALNVLATGDYVVSDDFGISGNNTTQMLARVGDVIASPADIVLFQAGHNDLSQSFDLAVTYANIDAILSNLLSANKKVIISLMTYRNRVGEPNTQHNANVDLINAHYILRASELTDVDVTAVPSDYNALVMSNQVDFGGVTEDGLHPNNLGGMMYGAHLIAVLESLYQSLINKETNTLNPFIGTGGILSSGATGLVPDGWRGYYADPDGDVGFSSELSGGKNWVIMTTNGVIGSNKDIGQLAKSPVEPCTEGWWVLECLLKFSNPELCKEFRLELDSSGSTYEYTRFSALEADGFGFPVDDIVRVRTPKTRLENGTMTITILHKQLAGVNATVKIADIKAYKVEDI